MTTLAEITKRQDELAEMIAAIKRQPIFPVYVTAPTPAPGEKWIGVVISADGTKREHLYLLPGEVEKTNWKEAMEWAAGIGGELFDRTEGALLFATMKDEFKPEWYWTREQPASDSDYAWFQYFVYGDQVIDLTFIKLRARAVRRSTI